MSVVGRLVATLVLVAAALVVLGACGDRGPSPSPLASVPSATSGVAGMMTLEGGPAPGSWPDPNVKIVVHRGAEDGPVVATTTSAADGSFSVDLPPGRYTLVPVALGDEQILSATATVQSGQRARVHVGFSVR